MTDDEWVEYHRSQDASRQERLLERLRSTAFSATELDSAFAIGTKLYEDRLSRRQIESRARAMRQMVGRVEAMRVTPGAGLSCCVSTRTERGVYNISVPCQVKDVKAFLGQRMEEIFAAERERKD